MKKEKNEVEQISSLKDLFSLKNHSASVKAGNSLEEKIRELLKETSSIKLLEIKEFADHQIDVIFMKGKKIYYLEIKGNINLDSEKQSYIINNKLKPVKKGLKKKYPGKEIKACVMVPYFVEDHWKRKSRIEKHREDSKKNEISDKFIENVLFGKEFLEILDLNWEREEWYDFLRKKYNEKK